MTLCLLLPKQSAPVLLPRFLCRALCLPGVCVGGMGGRLGEGDTSLLSLGCAALTEGWVCARGSLVQVQLHALQMGSVCGWGHRCCPCSGFAAFLVVSSPPAALHLGPQHAGWWWWHSSAWFCWEQGRAQQSGGDGCDQRPLLCWRLLLGQSRSAGVTMASPCLQPGSVSQRAATQGNHHPPRALLQRGWGCAMRCARQLPC